MKNSLELDGWSVGQEKHKAKSIKLKEKDCWARVLGGPTALPGHSEEQGDEETRTQSFTRP